MSQLIETFVLKQLRTNNNEGFAAEQSDADMVSMVIAFVIAQVVIMFLGRWLWNGFLTKLVTVVKPMKSVWQMLGVSVLLRLLYR